MLMLIMFFLTLPAALIVENSPNFARMTVIVPQLAIFLRNRLVLRDSLRRSSLMWFSAGWPSRPF